MRDKITVIFADEKEAEVRSFTFNDIYKGLLAGSAHDLTERLLEGYFEPKKKSGVYFKLTDDQFVPNEGLSREEWLQTRVLRRYLYTLELLAIKNNFGVLKVKWIDDAPPTDEPLQDYIAKHIAGIDFWNYAEEKFEP